jgi:hypothetical protein
VPAPHQHPKDSRKTSRSSLDGCIRRRFVELSSFRRYSTRRDKPVSLISFRPSKLPIFCLLSRSRLVTAESTETESAQISISFGPPHIVASHIRKWSLDLFLTYFFEQFDLAYVKLDYILHVKNVFQIFSRCRKMVKMSLKPNLFDVKKKLLKRVSRQKCSIFLVFSQVKFVFYISTER